MSLNQQRGCIQQLGGVYYHKEKAPVAEDFGLQRYGQQPQTLGNENGNLWKLGPLLAIIAKYGFPFSE